MKPLIAITSNAKVDEAGLLNYYERSRYVDVIVDLCSAIPIIIPPIGDKLDIAGLLARVDGFLFTGSPSNVHPENYNFHKIKEETLEDRMRDATTLPLIRAAIEYGKPTFCICRGFQELNVALGGSLHQHVEELPGKMDHRWNDKTQFEPVHDIEVVKGGMLEKIYNGKTKWAVNSAHGQGIDQLAKPLQVEAWSPDGMVEAVSMPNAKGYLFGTQWHPEHATVRDDWHNKVLFDTFMNEVRAGMAKK